MPYNPIDRIVPVVYAAQCLGLSVSDITTLCRDNQLRGYWEQSSYGVELAGVHFDSIRTYTDKAIQNFSDKCHKHALEQQVGHDFTGD